MENAINSFSPPYNDTSLENKELITNPIEPIQEKTSSFATPLFEKISSTYQKTTKFFKKIWTNLTETFSGVVRKINHFIKNASIFSSCIDPYEHVNQSTVQEVINDIQLESHLLNESIQNLKEKKFDSFDSLSQLSQIYFEVEENQSLFKEMAENCHFSTEEESDTVHQLRNKFAELKIDLNELVIKQRQNIEEMIINLQAFDEYSPLHEWNKKIYTRCFQICAGTYEGEYLTNLENLSEKLNFEIPSSSDPFNQSAIIDPNAPIGIKNGGNNCYAIASMQAILASPLFLEKINTRTYPPRPIRQPNQSFEDYNKKLLEHKEICRKLNAVQTALQRFKKVLDENANESTLNKALVNLRNIIFDQKLHPSLVKSEVSSQQDAADFFSVILQALDYNIGIETTTQNEASAVTNSSKQTCQIYPLGIRNDGRKKSIEELIQDNILEKVNDQDNQAVFLKDNEEIKLPEYDRIMRIANEVPPPVLCFQIKRFGYDAKIQQAFRIADNFSFPSETLDLSSIFNSPLEQPARYRLVSCVNHHGGKSASSGHYTAYVRKDEQWYNCNDSAVHPVSAENVDKEGAYLLMFEKI